MSYSHSTTSARVPAAGAASLAAEIRVARVAGTSLSDTDSHVESMSAAGKRGPAAGLRLGLELK